MPAHDLTLLEDAAREAGRIALRFWKRDPQVWEKPGQGPVTEADHAVNAMLAATLRAARPDYGWLSEETEDDPARLSATRVFIVDPIDGTRAFIAGEETFAHSLAVAEHGRVIAGAVHLPVPDLMFSATVDGTVTCNGVPIRASDRETLKGATLLTTASTLAPQNWPGGVPDVRRVLRSSLAYRMCLVAEGAKDGMATLRPAWEWDVAAGTLICERAGAVVTDPGGAGLRFNAAHPQVPGVIAAGPALHAALMDRLRHPGVVRTG